MTQAHKHKSTIGAIARYVVPLAVTVGLCWLMFHSVDINDIIGVIRRDCNFAWIGLALFISIFSHIFRAYRWSIQLSALGITPPKHILVYSIFGTYAINLLVPRLGEVWRTGYISQRQRAPFSTVFGSMVADRLSDTVTVLLLVLLMFLLTSHHLVAYLHQNEDAYAKVLTVATSPWLWLAVAACLGAAWWFLTRKSAKGSIFDKVQTFVKGLWQGFAVIGTMHGKGRWLLLTLGIWGCYFLQLYVAFFAFPFTAHVARADGIVAVLVCFVLSSIAMGVPSNGGIGPYQWSVMFALGLYNVDKTQALAFANVVLGTQTLLLIALGIFTFIAIMIDKKRHPELARGYNNATSNQST